MNFHQEGDTESTFHRRDLQWLGTCIHTFQTPKWVQKQRWIEPDSEIPNLKPYVEPRRVACVAINSKFSLIGIGTSAGAIHLTNFPSEVGIVPKSQQVESPNMFNKPTGEVTALDWSSDGYVLAVGWEHGWGIFSVGGKCLAFSVGIDETIDEGKYVQLSLFLGTLSTCCRFQDIYMFGVKGLVNFFYCSDFFSLFTKSLQVLGSGKFRTFYSRCWRSARPRWSTLCHSICQECNDSTTRSGV